MQRFILTAIGIMFGIAFLRLVAGCQTPQQLENCDAYMARVAGAHIAAGGQVAAASAEVTPDGVVLFLQVVNVQAGRVNTEVLVDTDALAAKVKADKLTPAGQCSRGGKTWQAFTGVVTLPPS